jgi:hypothetical protein
MAAFGAMVATRSGRLRHGLHGVDEQVQEGLV